MKKIDIKLVKLTNNARIPEYKTTGSAGFDFYCIENVTIEPKKNAVLIRTGLSVAIPEGYEMQIRPRSGLSFKTMLRIPNSPGTIDSDYRGEIKIIVENIGSEKIEIKEGDRIAQGIINKVPQANFIEVEKLDDTDRSDGGFGHTDTK